MDKNKHKDEGFDEIIFKPDLDIRFGNKSSLKRSEETGIALEDEKAIAIIEGDAEMDKEAFEAFFMPKQSFSPIPLSLIPIMHP